MIYIASNIIYDDSEGEYIDDLPDTIEIDVPNDVIDPEEIEVYISDEISNITGFCHLGFNMSKK